MTGRPGNCTVEMNGGSTASSVVPRAHPLRPCVFAYFNRFVSKAAFRFPGVDVGSLPLYGGIFARSYSLPIVARPFS